MKNFVFGFVAFAVLALVANDSFAGCRSCGRSGLGLRANKGSCKASSCASSCSTAKAPVAAPAAKAVTPVAKVESSSCANGSCNSAGGLRGRLRLR